MDNELQATLFSLVQQKVASRGVDIRLQSGSNSLRLEFADGQRIVINLDPNTHNVWLAARTGGTEYLYRNGTWRAHDQGELFVRLDELLDQTISSNPINARPPVAAEPVASPPPPVVAIQREAQSSHTLRNVAIVLLAGLFGFWIAQRSGNPAATASNVIQQTQSAAQERTNPGPKCEKDFPANGSITTFPENGWRDPAAEGIEVALKNDHSHPLLLILTAPDSALPVISVLLHARQEAAVHLPAGRYDLMFSAGSTWCNPANGFSDGQLLKFGNALDVEADKPVQMAMQSNGAGVEDFQLFIRTAMPEVAIPEPTFSGDGSMEVRRHPNGHFYLPGSIENVPVTFMVDTGASVTSISSDIAKQAGIRNCKEVQFQTANGAATGCIALLPNMTLGNFVLKNITVAVMPNMEINLLGANVLRNFQVSQSDTVMLIGRR